MSFNFNLIPCGISLREISIEKELKKIKNNDILSNRLTCLNNEVILDWLNLSLTAFKLKAKKHFLES